MENVNDETLRIFFYHVCDIFCEDVIGFSKVKTITLNAVHCKFVV